MRPLLLAGILSWAAASACAAPAEMADLAGTYVLSIETDTLRLERTGRYTRTWAQIGTPRLSAVDTGQWRLSRNGRLVALRAFPQRWPEHGRFDPKTGRWHEADTTVRRMQSLLIESTWRGVVTLGVKPEIGWRYRRLSTD